MKISVCVAVLQEKKFAMDNTIIIPYSDVESKKEWLWKYRMPHKNVAFLYGSSEDAVEALIAEIIACVSMGRALAVDNMSRQAGRVIYQNFKDGQIGAVKASLERQKADC